MTYSVSPHMVSLERFIVRSYGGMRIGFQRLKRLSSCGMADQLIAAILRKDVAATTLILEMNDASWSEEFFEIIDESKFSGLVIHHLLEMGLHNRIAEIPVKTFTLQQLLRQSSFEELAAYEEAELRLEKLLRYTGDLRQNFYLIKGIALARTVYSQPQFRGSSDIDILVHPSHASALVERLFENKFTVVMDLPIFAPQRGSGPFNSVQDLFIRPAPEYAPCEALTVKREGWPYIELKFDPLDNGLTMNRIEDFWHRNISIPVGAESFLAPELIEHTLLSVCHFHKNAFTGWQWLYDIALLSKQIDQTSQWQKLVDRCNQEGVSSSAWASLVVVQDRLGIHVPDTVLSALEKDSRLSAWFSFTIPNRFMWNLNSLPILWLNSIYCGDGPRKRQVLAKTLNPPTQFLQSYYGGKSGPVWLLIYWMLHMAVLFLPSGLTRRTLGKFVWSREQQFTSESNHPV